MAGNIEVKTTYPQQSLLQEIKSEGLVIVRNDPAICDRLGYPGHHPGIYDMEKSSGSNLHRLDGETIYDASNF